MIFFANIWYMFQAFSIIAILWVGGWLIYKYAIRPAKEKSETLSAAEAYEKAVRDREEAEVELAEAEKLGKKETKDFERKLKDPRKLEDKARKLK